MSFLRTKCAKRGVKHFETCRYLRIIYFGVFTVTLLCLRLHHPTPIMMFRQNFMNISIAVIWPYVDIQCKSMIKSVILLWYNTSINKNLTILNKWHFGHSMAKYIQYLLCQCKLLLKELYWSKVWLGQKLRSRKVLFAVSR